MFGPVEVDSERRRQWGLREMILQGRELGGGAEEAGRSVDILEGSIFMAQSSRKLHISENFKDT